MSKEYDEPKVFGKSKDVVYSATFRSDGKLLAVGNAEGQIMVHLDILVSLLTFLLSRSMMLIRNYFCVLLSAIEDRCDH